jgi:drug/metabolite transporter (DMT)-like permease
MSRSRVHLKTYVSILVMVIFGPLGNVLISKGMKLTAAPAGGTAAGMAHAIARAFGSGTLWLGIACLVTFLIANMVVLSWADYSFVQPASAVAYGVVALLGYFVLGEHVSRVRWIGVFVICLGVLMVGRTPPRTTETPS